MDTAWKLRPSPAAWSAPVDRELLLMGIRAGVVLRNRGYLQAAD
jgi:hypothetical protein